MFPQVFSWGEADYFGCGWWVALEFETGDVAAPIGLRRTPLNDASGKERAWGNEGEVERDELVGWINRSVGQAEGLSDDVGTGEDVAFPHQEACAHNTAIGGADAHQRSFE